jgi:hypothetical protein
VVSAIIIDQPGNNGIFITVLLLSDVLTSPYNVIHSLVLILVLGTRIIKKKYLGQTEQG